MRGSKHAEGEEQHDDVDDENANIREDQCCDGEARIQGAGRPRESQHAGADTRHAETEHCPGHEEPVALASIAQKGGDIGDGAS